MRTIYQGTEVVIRIPVVDQDGNVKDLTGATALWRLGDTTEETTQLEVAAVVTNEVGGIIEVSLSKVITAAIPIERYTAQCIVTDAESDVQVVYQEDMQVLYMLQTP